MQIGPEKVIDVMEATGIPRDAPGLLASPSLTLGFASVTPLQMAAAYATFAAEGEYAPPFSVEEVRSSSGALLYEADPKPRQVIAPGVANEVTYALTQVVASGTGTNALGPGPAGSWQDGDKRGQDRLVRRLHAATVYGSTVSFARVRTVRSFRSTVSAECQRSSAASTQRSIWTAYMAAALEGQPVEQFPEPPAPVVTATPTPTPTPTPTTESPSPTPSPTTTSPKPTKSPTPTQSPDAHDVKCISD